jgi:hypothetical protein
MVRLAVMALGRIVLEHSPGVAHARALRPASTRSCGPPRRNSGGAPLRQGLHSTEGGDARSLLNWLDLVAWNDQ